MSKWNLLDKGIAKIRYGVIEKYIPKGGIVADIGCGQDADFLKKCSPLIQKGYGFDFRIQDEVVNNLQLENNKKQKKINLCDNCCDTVFMIAVLEHLEKPEEMIKEANRVLKQGGKLVLTTPTRLGKPILEVMAFKLHIINEDEILEHKHYYDKKEICELLKTYGFSDCVYKKFLFGMNSRAVAQKV